MTLNDLGLEPRRPWWKLALYCLGGSVLFLYVAVIVLLTVYEGRLIFLPPQAVPAVTPASAGLAFEDLHIPVDKGTYLHAWWIPSKDPDAKTLLYFHGNAGALEYEANREAKVFEQMGANLLLVDYRGYGNSSPLQPSGATTRNDALAALHYLERERHIEPAKIVLFGWSIGSGVATQLAVDAPEAGGLILLSPISSVPDVANESWVFRYPLRPSQWLWHGDDFANQDKIGSVHMPVLLIAGTADTLAPPWMARELYARANEPKLLRFIQGAGHEDIMQTRDGTFLREIEQFLAGLK
jgi:pimeloyl-ACP methyl ester carboxylesterase